MNELFTIFAISQGEVMVSPDITDRKDSTAVGGIKEGGGREGEKEDWTKEGG